MIKFFTNEKNSNKIKKENTLLPIIFILILSIDPVKMDTFVFLEKEIVFI